jgi:hypothetical protein
MPRHDPPPSSRWQGGAMTFGPAGRVIATMVWGAMPLAAVVLLAPPFSLVFVVVWLFLAPRGFRDIWAPAPIRPDAATALPGPGSKLLLVTPLVLLLAVGVWTARYWVLGLAALYAVLVWRGLHHIRQLSKVNSPPSRADT